MTYKDTLNWMFSQLPMYQRQGKVAYKKDLSNTITLANYLDNPEIKFKSVHVAGTNGKGSTSHMIASVLQEAGYKVGLYTSPHLRDFRERIKINGKVISKQFVSSFIEGNKSFLENNALSFFEMTVGMAFDYFAKKKVDIAIIEVGLGGRLDSTNIITPEVAVITNIGLDHTQFLGDTLAKIAFEKAGIIKKNVPVVIGETQAETKAVFEDIASEKQASILFADKTQTDVLDSDLKGPYQHNNIKTAMATLNILKAVGWKISDRSLESGLLHVVNNTGLQGRWQILQNKPKVICDIAHNREGLIYTLAQLQEEPFNKLHVVLGFVTDKDLNSVIDLFPKQATYYFCKPDIERGLDATKLCDKFRENQYQGEAFISVIEAYKKALNTANEDDVIYVGGSTFVVAEII